MSFSYCFGMGSGFLALLSTGGGSFRPCLFAGLFAKLLRLLVGELLSLDLLAILGWEAPLLIFLLLWDFFKSFFDLERAMDGLRLLPMDGLRFLFFLSRLVAGSFLALLLTGLRDLLLDLLLLSAPFCLFAPFWWSAFTPLIIILIKLLGLKKLNIINMRYFEGWNWLWAWTYSSGVISSLYPLGSSPLGSSPPSWTTFLSGRCYSLRIPFSPPTLGSSGSPSPCSPYYCCLLSCSFRSFWSANLARKELNT